MSKFIVNSFQLPNAVIDDLLADLTGAELKCYLYVLRKTKGWNREEDAISVSQFMKVTGLSNRKVIDACERLVELGLLEQKTGANKVKVFSVKDYKIGGSEESSLVKKVHGGSEESSLVKKVHGGSEESSQQVVKKVHTQNNNINNTTKNNKNPLPPKAKKFVAENFELPEWVNLEDWIGFCEMRKSIKKPLSEKACKIALGKLEDLKSQGENVSEVLKQSTFNNWQGLFRVHDSNGEKSSLTDNIDFQAVIDAFNDEFEGRYAEVELNDTTRKIILNLAPLLKNQTVEGFTAYFETYNEIAGEYYDRFGFSFVMKPETLQKVREGAL